MSSDVLKGNGIPGSLISSSLDKTLITFKQTEAEELRLYASLGNTLLKSFQIRYKNHEESTCNITDIKRCQMTKHSPFVIIGEDEGIGREVCWDSSKDEIFDLPDPGFTLVMNQSNMFVTFTEFDRLAITIFLACQRPGETMTTLEKVTQVKCGRSLICRPLVISTTQIVFLQTNKDNIREICVFDCGLDPGTIVCQSKLENLDIPEENKIIDIFLMADNSSVWIHHMNNTNNPETTVSVLWKPDTNNSFNNDISRGYVVGMIKSFSDFHQIEPKEIEEDFNRLNFKSIIRDYSIHIHQWRAEFEEKFGDTLVDAWLNRQRISHEVNGLTVINHDSSHLAIVVSSVHNSIYLVDWTDSSIKYFIKFTSAKIRHALFRTVDRTLLVTFGDGTITQYFVAGRLIAFDGREPVCDKGPNDDNVHRANAMLAPARAKKRASKCC